MDPLMKLYTALMADAFIAEQANGRIKFYEYPETGDVSGPYIVLDPLGSPLADVYGDDNPIVEEYLIQIDVWTKNRALTRQIAKRVTEILRQNSFGYTGSGVDEYDKETGIFREARRYTGKLNTSEMGAVM